MIGALFIFACTLIFILWRPLGLREAWFAVAGATVMLFTGYVHVGDAAALWSETGSVLLFLAGMLVAGYAADQAGVFTWLAYHTARISRGNGVLLYIGLYGIGVFVTVWFSLDTTAVVLAPIVYSIVRRLGLPALPFVFAATYVANIASLLLPVSNLTNLIVWNHFHIPFWHYAAIMALPAGAAVIVNLVLFLWIFRRDIPNRFAPDALTSWQHDTEDGPLPTLSSPRFMRGMLILLCMLIGLAIAPLFQWEIAIVALVGGGLLAVSELRAGSFRARQLLTDIAWDLLPFVFSLFLILRGVSQAGFSDLLQTLLIGRGAGDSFSDLLAIAFTTAIGSNLINNLPMLLAAVDSLAGPIAAGEAAMSTMYAALLGTNLGPNLTVIGSLATMLSLSIIGAKGLRISGLRYVQIGLITVPILLVVAVGGLWLTLKLLY